MSLHVHMFTLTTYIQHFPLIILLYTYIIILLVFKLISMSAYQTHVSMVERVHKEHLQRSAVPA